MSAPRVVVLDCGTGNVHSAVKALAVAGADVTLSADPTLAHEAAGLVVPGVGAFSSVMASLNEVGGGEMIDRRLAGSRPVLGICVGMQVMFERGLEHGIDTVGLGQWPGTVQRLDAPVLPHMGWNTVEAPADSTLFAGIGAERFYFVHTYAATRWRLDESQTFRPPRVTWSEHGERFVAAVENGPLTATQFHPEKSGAAGIRLLRNWVATLN